MMCKLKVSVEGKYQMNVRADSVNDLLRIRMNAMMMAPSSNLTFV